MFYHQHAGAAGEYSGVPLSGSLEFVVMKLWNRVVPVTCGIMLIAGATLFASEKKNAAASPSLLHDSRHDRFSIRDDIAFVSVFGNRPNAQHLQGFQRAVLFNARGEVVKRLELGRDSIYSLDKMIQENKTKGPLFIRMYRK